MTLSAANGTRAKVTSAAQAPAGLASAAAALRIGDLAACAGVSVDALRYYERLGLLRPAGRRASGYREYAPEAAALVRFIKRAQALGFTLAEVAELVRLRSAARRPSAAQDVRAVATAKIQDIDERVRELLGFRATLADLVEVCEATYGAADAGTASAEALNAARDAECPILGALDGDAADPDAVDTPEHAPERAAAFTR